MKKGRIDKNKLMQLLADGKTLTECARHFGVSPAAVHKAKKGVGVVVVKDIHLESAHRFVDQHLNTVEQLRKINSYANELLELCMRWQRGDDEAIQVLESQMKTVRVGKTEKFVKEFKFKDPRDVALKAMAEIRGQLRLQNETLAMLAEMSAVVEFQQELIQLLKEIDPNVKDEFLRRLSERRALRGAVKLD